MGWTPDHQNVTGGAYSQPRIYRQFLAEDVDVQRKSRNSKPFRICTYNTRTLHEEHLDNLLLEVDNNFKWDVIGLSETKLIGTAVEEVKSGHMLFTSGVAEGRRKEGVAFLVHKEHKNNVFEFKACSSRLAYIKLKCKNNYTVIIQGYAPDSSHSDDEVDEFYDSVQVVLDNVAKRDNLYVLGDFNAKIGGLNETYPEIVGCHTNKKEGGSNQRGLRLINFCAANDLYVVSSHFQHRRKYTWTSPDGNTRNTIDHILIRRKDLRMVKDVHTTRCIDISDHELVRCVADINYHKVKCPRNKSFDVNKLCAFDVKQQFQNIVSDELHDFDALSGTPLYCKIKDSIAEASKNVLDNNLRNDADWISSETKAAVELKHEIRQKLGDESLLYKLHKVNVKKLCRIDKEKALDNEYKNLEKHKLNQKYFEVMKKLKKMRTRKVKAWSIKSKDGVHVIDKLCIIERWAEFYEDLYNDQREHYAVPQGCVRIPEILLEEVISAINNMKLGKAPGPDGIAAEMLKAGGPVLQKALLKLMNSILETEQLPDGLEVSEIITLYKKGDRADCSNYRPINLLSHVYKLLMTILYKRISHTLIESLQATQAAYQPKRGTIEQIQSLQQIIEKCQEYRVNAFICFIDYRKAFDSLKQHKLWQALHEYTDVPTSYIKLLSNLYKHSSARIRTDLGISRMIQILKGVKQGDVLSALLFCVVIMVIMKETLEGQHHGVSIGGIGWSDFGYADDLGVLATTEEELKVMIKKIYDKSLEFGLEINFGKTKIMKIGPNAIDHVESIVINGNIIKYVNQFTYLGRVLHCTGDDTPDVNYRIGKGWQVFQQKKHILTSSQLSYRAKRQCYETYIAPTILYAAETVTWKPKLMSQMKVFQNHIMRWITGHRQIDRIPIEQLLRDTNFQNIENIVKKRKLQWFGHLKRCIYPVKTICEGLIQGSRRRGRPARRWIDDMKDWTEQTVSSLNISVHDRTQWRRICHDISSS